MKPLRDFGLVSFLALALAGCGTTAAGLLGGGKSAPLPGARETVLPETGTADAGAPSEPLVIPAAQPLASWSQPGGVAGHATGNIQLGASLKQAWAVSAGAGSTSYGRLTAQPIIDNGRAYVMDTEARVTALNASTGAKAWSISLVPKGEDEEGAYGGGIASDGGRIYAVTAFGEAIAINAADGKEVWRQKLDAPVRSAPTVADGKLFFVSVTNDVYALATADGTQAWRYQGSGEQASAISGTSPAVAGGIVLAPTTAGDLVAIDAASGMGLWTESLTALDTSTGLANLNDIAGRPVLSAGTAIALSHTGRLAAFNAKSGQRAWERELAGTETPWVAGGVIFVITRDQRIQAVSAKSGGSWWTKPMPAGNWAGPVLAGGRLIAVSSAGELAEINPQTGDLTVTQKLGGKFYIGPVVAGGTLYLLSDSAELIALR